MNGGQERIAHCRELAKEAERYAAGAKRSETRDDYLYIARQWHALADEVENNLQTQMAPANSGAGSVR